MSKFIAEKTIKEMIKHDKKIKDANILVMGLTFKEDCPDTRNSKVFDIVNELYEYGCKVDVYDPWIDIKDIQEDKFTFLEENPFELDKQYSAIIVAVGHKVFKEIKREMYDEISFGNSVIIDVKGIVENPSWRL